MKFMQIFFFIENRYNNGYFFHLYTHLIHLNLCKELIKRYAYRVRRQTISYEYSISRVLFRKAVIIIYLVLRLPASSSDTTREDQGASIPPPIWSYSGWVYLASLLPDCWCALTAPFHLYLLKAGGTHFCGTIPEVTLAGRYPASCPMELGLSSLVLEDYRDYLRTQLVAINVVQKMYYPRDNNLEQPLIYYIHRVMLYSHYEIIKAKRS